ncbi:hypothetical protein BH23PLA1_BH23PLA1_00220 [soil metagenome]
MTAKLRSGPLRRLVVSLLICLSFSAIALSLYVGMIMNANALQDAIRVLAFFGFGLFIGILMQAFFWPWVRAKAAQDHRSHAKEQQNKFFQTLETVRQYIANEPPEHIEGPNSGAQV